MKSPSPFSKGSTDAHASHGLRCSVLVDTASKSACNSSPRYLRNTIGGSSILSGGALGIASKSAVLRPQTPVPNAGPGPAGLAIERPADPSEYAPHCGARGPVVLGRSTCQRESTPRDTRRLRSQASAVKPLRGCLGWIPLPGSTHPGRGTGLVSPDAGRAWLRATRSGHSWSLASHVRGRSGKSVPSHPRIGRHRCSCAPNRVQTRTSKSTAETSETFPSSFTTRRWCSGGVPRLSQTWCLPCQTKSLPLSATLSA